MPVRAELESPGAEGSGERDESSIKLGRGESLTMRWVPRRVPHRTPDRAAAISTGQSLSLLAGEGAPHPRQDRLGRSVAGLTVPFLGNVSHTMTFVPKGTAACARRAVSCATTAGNLWQPGGAGNADSRLPLGA